MGDFLQDTCTNLTGQGLATRQLKQRGPSRKRGTLGSPGVAQLYNKEWVIEHTAGKGVLNDVPSRAVFARPLKNEASLYTMKEKRKDRKSVV